ncbi:hypothetical protein ACFL3V_02530 [Nanoarchaeota archaeon]
MVKVEILQQKGFNFLYIDDYLWMWDIPQEVEDQKSIADNAYGDVLVAGYGLGVVQRYLVANPQVSSVVTVETIDEVIQACEKVYGVIHGDVVIGDFYDFDSPRRFDCVLGDIWPDLGPQTVPEYVRFKEKAQSLLKNGGRVDGWGMDYMEFLLQKNSQKAPNTCNI